MTNAVSLAQQASTGVSQGFKNRWINGSMVINQRGGTTTVDGTEVYGLDRWKGADVTSGVFTMQQSSDAPTGSGFKYSLLATVTTADTSISAGEYAFLRQIIEGFNCADLNWGPASARTITVSFWVKSSVTGTYSFTVINEATTQSYPATYTINAANTWEFKSVTIPGSTTGTWNSTNGIGIYCDFALATGSSYTNTPNSWATSIALGATGQVNWLATNGNTFYLTGCQFEVGSSATSFEYRPYGTELMLCQRYCYVPNSSANANMQYASGFVYASSLGLVLEDFPVTMRSTPTLTVSGNFLLNFGGSNSTATGISINQGSPYNAFLNCNITGGVIGYGATLAANASTSTSLLFSAEL